jgi:hypothetical protein
MEREAANSPARSAKDKNTWSLKLHQRLNGVVFNAQGQLYLYFYQLTGHLEDLGVDGRMTLRWILINSTEGCNFDSSASRQTAVEPRVPKNILFMPKQCTKVKGTP